MEIPQRIEEWTYEKVVQAVREDEYEPGIYDFKEPLSPRDPKTLESIRKTTCAMANTDGGYIIFGVKDRASTSSPDDRIVGIPLGADLRKEFGDKIKVIQPPVYFEAIPAPFPRPSDSTKGIFIVRIPTSPLRPHMVESTFVFYRRGEGGSNVEMRRHEVRDQMLYTEDRLRKVTLLRLEIAQYLEQAEEIKRTNMYAESRYIPAHFDTGAFKTILADICIFPVISGDLLKGLLEVPTLANLTQKALQKEMEVRIIQGRAGSLERQCKWCEQRLAEIFGPLGSEGRPSASS